jgi:hypothetical protein
MNFERGQDPLTALDIGCERKLRKGDKFLLVVPAIMGSYGMNPERIEEATAIEDEISRFGQNGRAFLHIRQVEWEIFEVASGWAQRIDNRWTRIDKPRF